MSATVVMAWRDYYRNYLIDSDERTYSIAYKLGNKCTLNPNSRLFKDYEFIHACVFRITGMQKVDISRGVSISNKIDVENSVANSVATGGEGRNPCPPYR